MLEAQEKKQEIPAGTPNAAILSIRERNKAHHFDNIDSEGSIRLSYDKYQTKLEEIAKSLGTGSNAIPQVKMIQNINTKIDAELDAMENLFNEGKVGLLAQKAIGFQTLIQQQISEIDKVALEYTRKKNEISTNAGKMQYSLKEEQVASALDAWKNNTRTNLKDIRFELQSNWEKNNAQKAKNAIHGIGTDAIESARKEADEHDKAWILSILSEMEKSLNEGSNSFEFKKELVPGKPDTLVTILIPGETEAQKVAGLFDFSKNLLEGIQKEKKPFSAVGTTVDIGLGIGAELASFGWNHPFAATYLAVVMARHSRFNVIIPPGSRLLFKATTGVLGYKKLGIIGKGMLAAANAAKTYKDGHKIIPAEVSKEIQKSIIEGCKEQARIDFETRLEALRNNANLSFDAEGRPTNKITREIVAAERTFYNEKISKLQKIGIRAEKGVFNGIVPWTKAFRLSETGELEINEKLVDKFIRDVEAGYRGELVGWGDLAISRTQIGNLTLLELEGIDATGGAKLLEATKIKGKIVGHAKKLTQKVSRFAQRRLPGAWVAGEVATREWHEKTGETSNGLSGRERRFDFAEKMSILGKEAAEMNPIDTRYLEGVTGAELKKTPAEKLNKISDTLADIEKIQEDYKKSKVNASKDAVKEIDFMADEYHALCEDYAELQKQLDSIPQQTEELISTDVGDKTIKKDNPRRISKEAECEIARKAVVAKEIEMKRKGIKITTKYSIDSTFKLTQASLDLIGAKPTAMTRVELDNKLASHISDIIVRLREVGFEYRNIRIGGVEVDVSSGKLAFGDAIESGKLNLKGFFTYVFSKVKQRGEIKFK